MAYNWPVLLQRNLVGAMNRMGVRQKMTLPMKSVGGNSNFQIGLFTVFALINGYPVND